MANSSILKEYLVALGIKDNVTGKLKKILNQNSQSVKAFAKGLATAGTATASLLIAANTGIAKFTTGLVKADDELTKYAADIGKTKDEARALKYALDAMGKSMEEIEASPELQKTFQQLQKDAALVQVPDMSEGLNQVREIQTEFLRLKQAGSYTIQWVGHYLVKYLQQPMEKLRNVFSGLNDGILKNMPEWSKKIASVMASVVNITASIIRGATTIFNAIKRVFDMIPKEVEMVMGVLATLAIFIRAGLIGKLIMIFGLLMLLVEDFFTYLDGGESLLGPFWQKLIDIWEVLNKQGGAIDKLKEGFQKAMDIIVAGINIAIKWIKQFWDKLQENNAVDNFIKMFGNVWDALKASITAVKKSITAVFDVIKTLFGSADDMAEASTSFLAWLIGVALPGLIGFIADIVTGIAGVIGGVASAVSWFTQLEGAREVMIGLAAAIGLVVLAMKAQAIQTSILAAKIAVLAAVKKAYAVVQGIVNAVMMANPIFLIIAAIVALIAIVYLLIKNWDKVAEFFKGLWQKIKEPFVGIDQWFADKFNEVKEKILGVFRGVGDWFKSNWKTIVLFIINPFAGIFKYLYDNFEGFRNFVDGIVSAVVGFFVGLKDKIVGALKAVIDWVKDNWKTIVLFIINPFAGVFKYLYDNVEGFRNFVDTKVQDIKDFFANLGTSIVEFFTGAWLDAKEGVKEFIQSVIEFFIGWGEGIKEIITLAIAGNFKEAWDKAKKLAKDFISSVLNIFKPLVDFLGGIGDKIKSIFSGKKTMEVEGVVTTSNPNTGHAEGGIFTHEHNARISEGNQPEAVLPLTKPNRAKEVLSGVARFLGGGVKVSSDGADRATGGDVLGGIAANVASMVQMLAQLSSALGTLDNGLSQAEAGAAPGGTVNNIYHQNTFDMQSHYTIHDASGRPQSVAEAVDRKQVVRIRNLQGIYNTV